MLTDRVPQPDPTNEELKHFERSQQLAGWEGGRLSENERKDISFSRTPVEHQLSGSSAYGFVSSPNAPTALVANESLEFVNLVRMANPDLNLLLFAEVPGRGRQGLRIQVRLRPLTEDQTKSSEPEETFNILGATTYRGEPIDLTIQELREIYRDFVDERRASVRLQLIEDFMEQHGQKHD